METSIHSSISTAINSYAASQGVSRNQSISSTSTSSEGDEYRQTIFPGDRVNLSPEAREASQNNSSTSAGDSDSTSSDEYQLSAEEQQQLLELKSRDQEVRLHEQAHLTTAGQYAAGGPSFTYQTGPDGVRYAVGGEVPIDISKESTPEATIQKMETVRSAALAPASPSAADRAIAAQASITLNQARQELAQEQQENLPQPETVQGSDATITPITDTPDSGNPTQRVEPSNNSFPAGMTVKAMISAYSAHQATA